MQKLSKQMLALIMASGFAMLAVRAEANGTAVEEAQCQNAGYEKGFFIKTCDDEFKLLVNLQLQPQVQFLSMENQDNVHTFQLRRGRLQFSGHAFTKDLTYKFQYEAVGGRDSTTREFEARANSLRDAYINYKVRPYFQITGGQFKPFFNREELISSTKFQLASLSLANEVFTMGRDLGIGFHGKAFGENEDRFEWGLSVTNEQNSHNRTNANTELLVAARGVWNVMGDPIGYTQSDVKNSESTNVAVGLGMVYNKPNASGDDTIILTTGDVALMSHGFSFEGAGYFGRNSTDSLNILGFLGQAGYFIVPEKFEVAGRFAAVIPTAAGVTNGYEYGGGLNYFFKGHPLKLQTDYFMIKNSSLVFQGNAAAGSAMGNFFPGFVAGQSDHRLRTQLSVYF